RKADIKRAAKKRMRLGVDPSVTEQFTFALNASSRDGGPEWVEDNEFIFQGEMYDVVEKRIEGDRMIVRCISDKQEKKLMVHYKKLVEKDFGERSKKKASVFLKLITTLYTTVSKYAYPKFDIAAVLNVDSRQRPLLFVINEVPTPPPQIS
ncbi:MAG TPA: hypothetical protein VMZ03_06985, partial [Chitinophagaceae bacterium]|nr:hypothetical protein [Chitinophagaceae bacterium]